MSNYTIQRLCDNGKPFAMAMLLRAIHSGEPFVTYGTIKAELEKQLKIAPIFTVHIGPVAGTLMDDILREDPRAPLLNVMVARPNGIPSEGVSGYLSDRYGDKGLKDWKKVPRVEKLRIVERERQRIFAYPDWETIARRLYGDPRKLLAQINPEESRDFDPNWRFSSTPESKQHRRLKIWVSKNPGAVGVRPNPLFTNMEARLLSGDEVDVMFSSGTTFHVVEVKSRRSNFADYQRGIYQCVKYREVKRAEHAPFKVEVHALLVTEATLPTELQVRAKILGVKWQQVSIP